MGEFVVVEQGAELVRHGRIRPRPRCTRPRTSSCSSSSSTRPTTSNSTRFSPSVVSMTIVSSSSTFPSTRSAPGEIGSGLKAGLSSLGRRQSLLMQFVALRRSRCAPRAFAQRRGVHSRPFPCRHSRDIGDEAGWNAAAIDGSPGLAIGVGGRPSCRYVLYGRLAREVVLRDHVLVLRRTCTRSSRRSRRRMPRLQPVVDHARDRRALVVGLAFAFDHRGDRDDLRDRVAEPLRAAPRRRGGSIVLTELVRHLSSRSRAGVDGDRGRDTCRDRGSLRGWRTSSDRPAASASVREERVLERPAPRRSLSQGVRPARSRAP